MELQRNQPIKFGSDYPDVVRRPLMSNSDMEEVSDVEISFTGGFRKPRDVDEGSGETEPPTVIDPVPSQWPIIVDSGCPVATAATILICTVFF